MNAAEAQLQKFEKRINASLDAYRELLLAIYNKKKQATFENLLVEQFALSLGVAWQSFIHDLLLAYVIMEPTRYLQTLKARIRQSVQERYGLDAMKAISLSFPDTLSRPKAAALIDPKQWNITANSAQELAKRANDLLSAAHAMKFSLAVDDSAFIDFLTALRNYLGHYSVGSRDRLKETIATLNTGENVQLYGALHHIGPYLKARDAAGNTRAALIAERMLVVAKKLGK